MEPGDVIASRYRVDRVLSLHGTRQRFVGEAISDHTRVVIDTLHDSMIHNADALHSLRYEIGLSQTLNEPYFMGIIETCTQDDRVFVIWKFIDAEALTHNDSLAQLTPRDIYHFVASVVRAITIAHKKGVIHGALSTDVILMTPQLEPVIIGFALPGVEPETDPGSGGGISAYQAAAPELFQGEPIDESCDFYAVGVIAQFLLDTARRHQELHTSPASHIRPGQDADTEQLIHAKELISGLMSSDRSVRVECALRIADPSFLDTMATPPHGNDIVSISRRESRAIKKRLKVRKPHNDHTEQLIFTALRFIAIAVIAIGVVLVLAKITQ